jgi:histidyl-tRNA synthetase
MGSPYQPLPGFRDFAPRDRLLSRYLFEAWTRVATRYGFSEYEAPILESAALYLKKSGGELSGQLFRFTDKGDRDVVLRPELTASLARIVADQQRDYPKPLKWFEIGRCFRYEKPQRGRLREFYQFNADIMGEASAGADAELIALSIDVMRELGFQPGEFVVRLSDREAWAEFCRENGVAAEQLDAFLQIVDKIERDPEVKLRERLQVFGLELETIREFIATADTSRSENLAAVLADLESRGLAQFAEIDLSIVRGLAYYTGVVFEVFDASKSLRSVAGGGRYDSLISIITDGSTDLAATGYAMGDCVIAELINETPQALAQFVAWRQRQATCDVYVIIADDSKRSEAIRLVSALRESGLGADYPLSPTKINKQFKAADRTLARFAIVVGSEFPELKLKNLNARTEESIAPNADPIEILKTRLNEPDGPLLT